MPPRCPKGGRLVGCFSRSERIKFSSVHEISGFLNRGAVGVALDVLANHGHRIAADERNVARRAFVDHHSHGIQVGAMVERLALGLLRAHVAWGAPDRPALVASIAGDERETEVGELRLVGSV